MDDTTLNGVSTDIGTNGSSPSTGWRDTYDLNHVPADPDADRERCFAYDCTRRLADAGAVLCHTHRKRYLEVSS